jgi:hypothetical protein
VASAARLLAPRSAVVHPERVRYNACVLEASNDDKARQNYNDLQDGTATAKPRARRLLGESSPVPPARKRDEDTLPVSARTRGLSIAVALSKKAERSIPSISVFWQAIAATSTGSISLPIATSRGQSAFGPELSLLHDSGAGNGALQRFVGTLRPDLSAVDGAVTDRGAVGTSTG